MKKILWIGDRQLTPVDLAALGSSTMPSWYRLPLTFIWSNHPGHIEGHTYSCKYVYNQYIKDGYSPVLRHNPLKLSQERLP